MTGHRFQQGRSHLCERRAATEITTNMPNGPHYRNVRWWDWLGRLQDMHQWTSNCFVVLSCGLLWAVGLRQHSQDGRRRCTSGSDFQPVNFLQKAHQANSSPAPAVMPWYKASMPGGAGSCLCIRAGQALAVLKGTFESEVCRFHFSLAPRRDGVHCTHSTGP